MSSQITDIHPELRAGANRMPPLTFSAWNLRLIRLFTRLSPVPKAPDGIHIENTFIALPDSPKQMRLRIYRPTSIDSPVPILLWLHGGGYIIGQPEISEAACIEYVRELGLVIVSVDYRLAPEYPFPTPLEDAYTALKWAHNHANELGIDTARLAIGGESAGGGLAAALVQLAHDRREFKTAFQLLVYPMLDNQTTLRTDLANRRYLGWNQKSNHYGWTSYLGKMVSNTDIPSYAVPARREDLSGLPPTWMGVGTLDLFYDEDIAYAQRLKACGVECELSVVQGAFHGFDVIASSNLQVIRDFRKAQIAAMKRYLF